MLDLRRRELVLWAGVPYYRRSVHPSWLNRKRGCLVGTVPFTERARCINIAANQMFFLEINVDNVVLHHLCLAIVDVLGGIIVKCRANFFFHQVVNFVRYLIPFPKYLKG